MEKISPEQINKLLLLSRIELEEGKREKIAHDIEAILGYVSELAAADIAEASTVGPEELRNVMRADIDPYERGVFRDALLAAAPAREGNYFKVKKIL